MFTILFLKGLKTKITATSLEHKATHGSAPTLLINTIVWGIGSSRNELRSLPCTGQVRSDEVRQVRTRGNMVPMLPMMFDIDEHIAEDGPGLVSHMSSIVSLKFFISSFMSFQTNSSCTAIMLTVSQELFGDR